MLRPWLSFREKITIAGAWQCAGVGEDDAGQMGAGLLQGDPLKEKKGHLKTFPKKFGYFAPETHTQNPGTRPHEGPAPASESERSLGGTAYMYGVSGGTGSVAECVQRMRPPQSKSHKPAAAPKPNVAGADAVAGATTRPPQGREDMLSA